MRLEIDRAGSFKRRIIDVGAGERPVAAKQEHKRKEMNLVNDGNDKDVLEQTIQRTYGPQTKKPPTPMRDEAYYGLAGDVVKLAASSTEECPEALLIQLLIGLGNMIGRDAYIKQWCWHHLNEFVCIVGGSSTGRIGISWRVMGKLTHITES